jgi:tripartite-type tricarboxylate transporter receptor subunit TctC
VKILAQPDFKERMLAVGFEPVGDPPDKFAAFLRAEMEKWTKVVRQADIHID